MKNQFFDIFINSETGFVERITHPDDKYAMNWCSDNGSWGRIHCDNRISVLEPDFHFRYEQMRLESFSESESYSEACYNNGKLSVKVLRKFETNGNYTETYIITNNAGCPVSINSDNFGIELAFSDKYTFADECMTNHCNTHIWCGHHFSYVNALRMGSSNLNLGLILTQGAIDSYSQNGCESNNRGSFVLEPETIILCSGRSYVISWELFWHRGGEDFKNNLSLYDNYIGIDAAHYTVFEGEKIEFKVSTSSHEPVEVYLKNNVVNTTGDLVSYLPESTGDFHFIIKAGEKYTFAEFTVKPTFSDLVEQRVRFIAEHQQCLDKSSPLYGAYLIYDNKTKAQYFDDSFPDHNACRERIGMALLLAKYLQFKKDEAIRASLDLYIEFLFREFYDSESGEVYNTIGKNRNMIRLYNAPWVMTLFCEMYNLTSDKYYLDNIVKIAENYYSLGGKKFYPNGIEILGIIDAFNKAKMTDEAQKMTAFFAEHVDNMIANGISYPKHEVNYEQTIVTPAATLVSEMGILKNDKTYIEHARKHIECLERFSYTQPSFHLNEIPVRYWDDFWFGKSMMFGDVYPHYWSCLSARSYIAFGKLCSEADWLVRAEEVLRNCMCLFADDGTGSSAYVYPHTLDGKKGEFYDEWANDQDFALYFAVCSSESIGVFDICTKFK